MLPIQQLQELIQGKKVAFIGAGVSHKRCIEQFVELGAQVTLCDQKKSLDDFGDYADTLRRLKCLADDLRRSAVRHGQNRPMVWFSAFRNSPRCGDAGQGLGRWRADWRVHCRWPRGRIVRAG